MSEWRPISEAPKDEYVLLFWRHKPLKVPVVRSGAYDGKGRWTDGSTFVKPTHWMPLPNPPHERG